MNTRDWNAFAGDRKRHYPSSYHFTIY